MRSMGSFKELLMKAIIPLFVIAAILYFLIRSIRSNSNSNADSSDKYKQPAYTIPEFNVNISYGNSSNFVESKPDEYKWIQPGESVVVAGYTIPDGMVYVGKHLKSGSSYYHTEDPALIKTYLIVSSNSPDRQGNNMDYWPSYSNIPPSSRAAYLEWLAGGKVDPEINIGYVFLFFYGIERRLLHDRKHYHVSNEEIRRLLDEINVLLNIYGSKSGSFKHYANSLMEYVYLSITDSKFYDLEPPPIKYTYEVGPLVKLALGQLALEGKPLVANWMYEYVIHHPEMYLKTPARRCTEEFRKLFIIHYNNKFGDGIVVKPNKTNVTVSYRCASSGMGEFELATNSLNIPDVSILKTLLNKVKPIVNECQDELDKYSRWLGKKENQENSLIGYSFLPDILFSTIENKDVEEFKKWLSGLVNGGESAIVSNMELIKRWSVKNSEKMTKKEFLSFISFLQKLGFGIEPDIRFDGGTLKAKGQSVLFKLNEYEEVLDSPSSHYSAKLVLLQFAVAVAKADNVIAEGEQMMLIDSIENTSKLNPAEKRRMKNSLTWLLKSDASTQGLKKKVESFDQKQKDQLADYMVAIAGADGFISPEEVKMLSKLFKLLSYDEKQVYSSIHRYQTDMKDSSDELVSVRPADSVKSGFSIPKPSMAYEEEGFALDRNKIASKIKDTERVSQLLQGVFAEEIPDEPEEIDIVGNENTIHGLDENHSAILFAFQNQSLWPRSEFEKLASQHELMPDGALEVINEKAYELFDDALCEIEDPIEINQEILKEFLK